MKKNLMLFFVLSLLILVSGCSFTNKQNVGQKDPPINDQTKKDNVEESNPLPPVNENISEFSIVKGDNYVTLGEYENQGVLLELFGQPISEEVKVLGSGSDTFTGSFLKNVKYSDFDITFMSPKGDGKKFWILDMKTDSNMYKTKRGIKAGDSVDDLTKAYPDIHIVEDGRIDLNNCAYEFNENRIDYVMFEVAQGKITEIKLFRELP